MNILVRRMLRGAIDLVVLAGAYVLAFELRFEGQLSSETVGQVVITLPYVVALQYAIMGALQLPRFSWRYTSVVDVARIVRAMLAATLVLATARLVAPAVTGFVPGARYALIPFAVIAAHFAFSVVGVVGVRIFRRLECEAREARRAGRWSMNSQRVLLMGAGRAGALVATELRARPDLDLVPVGFIDDSHGKQRQIIQGLPVLGTSEDLPRVAAEHGIDQVIISVAKASRREIRRMITACKNCGLDARIIPGLYDLVGGHVEVSQLRPVVIDDLLGRDAVELDVSAIEQTLQHEVVLVTGAGGSIGSELCRQVARFRPRELVLVERSEHALWRIHRELQTAHPGLRVVPRIADVGDEARMDDIVLSHRPSTIFHAAAHKHVPMMEWNPGEAVKNNVFGTKTVADVALRRGVPRFVFISTDKAVNPTSVMGATKRIGELYVQRLAEQSGRQYLSVRFGNVLGSAGSVVEVFQQQIAEGGPVTVTHPEMCRYFMTIPEAAQLVLQAASMGRGAETFILDMGEPVKIVDFAEDLIRLSGLVPGEDIEVVYAGLRPGEKLFEELSLGDENVARTRHSKIWIGKPSAVPSWNDLQLHLSELQADPVRGVAAVLPLFDSSGDAVNRPVGRAS